MNDQDYRGKIIFLLSNLEPIFEEKGKELAA